MPPLTEQEQIAAERAATEFWSRCAAAGMDEHQRYAWEGMYRANPENAEEHLAAHRASYVPPVPFTDHEAALASFGVDPFKDPERAIQREERVRAAARRQAQP